MRHDFIPFFLRHIVPYAMPVRCVHKMYTFYIKAVQKLLQNYRFLNFVNAFILLIIFVLDSVMLLENDDIRVIFQVLEKCRFSKATSNLLYCLDGAKGKVKSLLSNLFVWEKTKNDDAGGIGIICVGGLLTSDIRRGLADTTRISLSPSLSKSVFYI